LPGRGAMALFGRTLPGSTSACSGVAVSTGRRRGEKGRWGKGRTGGRKEARRERGMGQNVARKTRACPLTGTTNNVPNRDEIGAEGQCGQEGCGGRQWWGGEGSSVYGVEGVW